MAVCKTKLNTCKRGRYCSLKGKGIRGSGAGEGPVKLSERQEKWHRETDIAFSIGAGKLSEEILKKYVQIFPMVDD